ncbi:MAG: T9SS type A sorting domain-containing protein, partial [Maribacter sp.]|uniref:T9SS type A sorting domain-containing protein n=1 Tax=Maribacter sp. TaxID=1897614 RepID=UPI003C726479
VNLDLLNRPYKNIAITITNISGSKIFQKEYNVSEKITIDLAGHVSGMYFVKIRSGNNEIVKKLILNRK